MLNRARRKAVVGDGSSHACSIHLISVFFFFQAEDGIRDKLVTGVQTCALPILAAGVARGIGVEAVSLGLPLERQRRHRADREPELGRRHLFAPAESRAQVYAPDRKSVV